MMLKKLGFQKKRVRDLFKLFGKTAFALSAILLLLTGFTESGQARSFRYAEDKAPNTLNPIFANDMYSVRANELIHGSLVGFDMELKPRLQLAKEILPSEDSMSATITLKENITWHDGKPVSADDIIFTYKAMTHPKTPTLERGQVAFISSMVKVTAKKIKVTFVRPIDRPLRFFNFKILPKHKFTKPFISITDYFGRQPVGAGPYAIRSWSSNNRIRLGKALGFSPKPRIDSIELQEIPDKNTQKEVLKYGGLDAIIRVRPKEIPVFEQVDSIELYPYTSLSWWYIALNHRNLHFKSKLVRQAIAFALDRNRIREAHLGDGDTISGPFAPQSAYYNFSVEPRSFKLQKSISLLKEAGYKKIKKNWFKKGKKLKFSLVVDKSMSIYKNVCLDIQSQLNNLGVPVSIKWLTSVEINLKVLKRKKFDAYISRWSFDDSSVIYPLFHSKGNLNYIGYKNKLVDQLLDDSKKTSDPELFRSIYMDLHKYLHKDLPYVFLFSLIGYSAVSSDVVDVVIHPFYYYSFFPGWNFRK